MAWLFEKLPTLKEKTMNKKVQIILAVIATPIIVFTIRNLFMN